MGKANHRANMKTDKLQKIDLVDRNIMRELSVNRQVSNKKIALNLGVSESTISSRIESLLKHRIMKAAAQINVFKSELKTIAYVDIYCRPHEVDRISNDIGSIDEVFSVSKYFDNPFLLVLVMAISSEEICNIVERRIGTIPGVDGSVVDISLGDLCIKSGIAAL